MNNSNTSPKTVGKIALPNTNTVRLDANDLLKDYRKRLQNYKNIIVNEIENEEINRHNIDLALLEINLIKNNIVVLKDYIDNSGEYVNCV